MHFLVSSNQEIRKFPYDVLEGGYPTKKKNGFE